MKLGKVLVFAKDLPRLHAFYRDALGLTPTAEHPDWTELDAGGTALALHAIPPPYAAGIQISDPPAPRSDTPLKVIFIADDVPAARARLAEHGASMRELRELGDGRLMFDCLDPEGNVFRVSSPTPC